MQIGGAWVLPRRRSLIDMAYDLSQSPLRRVHVTGNAGTGKTTTAIRLAEMLGIERVGLDSVVWAPRWKPVPAEERRRRELEIAARPTWVVDGVSRPIREAADTIVFLDFPRRVSFARCARRNSRYLFRSRPDLPEHCPEIRILPTLAKLIWQFPSLARPRILADFQSWHGTKTLVHVRDGAELELFVEAVRHTMQRLTQPAQAFGT